MCSWHKESRHGTWQFIIFFNGLQILDLRTKINVHITRQKSFWFSQHTFSLKYAHTFDVILTVHHRSYVEIKCQLDATEVFIADLIACSTCFGHHYVHRQEL